MLIKQWEIYQAGLDRHLTPILPDVYSFKMVAAINLGSFPHPPANPGAGTVSVL